MLARRLTTILPVMTLAEALETTRIHRVAGCTGDRTAVVAMRPCRTPHISKSDVTHQLLPTLVRVFAHRRPELYTRLSRWNNGQWPSSDARAICLRGQP